MSVPGSRLPGTGFGGGRFSNSRLPGAPLGGRLGSTRLPGTAATGREFDVSSERPFGGHSTFDLISNRERYIREYRDQLVRRGLSRSAADSAARVAWEREAQGTHQPTSFLHVLGKVLSTPEKAFVGFSSGFLSKMPTSSNPWDFISSLPHQTAAGYHEAGRAIHGKKDWGEYIRQSHPNDFVGRHAGSIGMAASLVFDPVMYMSFGATAPAKIAANRALGESAREAMRRADNIISKDGMYFGTKYGDRVELMQAIRHNEGMPMNLPQALDELRATGRGYKSSMRRLRSYESFDPITREAKKFMPTPLRVAGAYALPTAVRGGQGIRFAGMEVPFTGDIAASLGRRVRGNVSERVMNEAPVTSGLVHGFMTSPTMRLMGEDTIRALALTEMAAYKAELQTAKVGAQAYAREVGKGGERKFTRPEERAGAHMIEPPILREGVTPTLRTVKGEAMPRIQQISRQVHERVTKEIEHAKAVRIPESEARELWQTIAATTDDPVEAIGQFVFQNQVKVRSREFVKRILDNPLFAIKVEKGEALPPGYKALTDHENQRYAVLGEMSDALDDLLNPQFLDKSTKTVMDAMRLPQNYWKQFATSANPSFHVMNFLGAVWNNLYAGVYNPADYVKALTTLYRSRMEDARLAGQGRYLGRTTEATGKRAEKRAAAHGVVQEATARGATSDTASIFAEIQEGIDRGRGPFVPEAPPSVQARLHNTLMRRPRESRKRYALRQTRRGTAVGMLATGNPIGIALLAPEAAAAGRVIGTTIEDVVRLAPFMKGAKDPVLVRYLDAFGPPRVPGMVHPTYSKEAQRAMYDIGASISKHFQFDYSDLTTFERRFAKTIFPFYTFYRKNFVLQMQLAGQAPRGVHSAQAVMNYANENGDISDEMRQLLPEYFDQIAAFQIPVPQGVRKKLGLPTDQPLFLNPKLPFVSLNLMPALWNVFQDTGQPTPQKVMGVFAPMYGSIGPFSPLPLPGMKIMLEASVGESLGLNKSLDYQRAQSNDYRNSWVPAPGWVKYLPKPVRDFMGIFPWGKTVETEKGFLMTATGQYVLNQMATPFITNLGQAIPVGGTDEGKSRADLVSWMTGVRLIPADMLRIHRSWAYRMESMLEGKRQDLRDQGKDLEPEDLLSLQMIRAQIKVLEYSWDTRQEELYGTR